MVVKREMRMFFFSKQFFNDVGNILQIVFYVALVVVGIMVIIHLYFKVSDLVAKNKEKERLDNYVENIPIKYSKLNYDEKKEIYKILLSYSELENDEKMTRNQSPGYTRREIGMFEPHYVYENELKKFKKLWPSQISKFNIDINLSYVGRDVSYLRNILK
ncbi:MAG: hypothetical protein ACI4HO_00750 [Ruminococcus sp.]